MAEKRKDSKNRNLNAGESQRKDGKYEYKYTDVLGNRKSIYSWRLVPTDKMPQGKKFDLSLREKEQEIKKELELGIVNTNKTVADVVEDYIALKNGLKYGTIENYNISLIRIKRYSFANMKINKVKMQDAKMFAKQLKNDGFAFPSIRITVGLLYSAFNEAIRNDEILKNPFNFKLSDVIKNDTKPRQALTESEKQRFLDFLKDDPIYSKIYNEVYILLHTGLRIAELCGLTFDDIDLEKKRIKISHQLSKKGRTGCCIQTPKSSAGYREIAISDDVVDILKKAISERTKPKVEPIVDGYTNFIFLARNGMPQKGHLYEQRFRNAVNKYNQTHSDSLPKITPHILRHTYCTDMVHKNINPKSLQYLMGHSTIAITMNEYTHTNADIAADDFNKAIESNNTMSPESK